MHATQGAQPLTSAVMRMGLRSACGSLAYVGGRQLDNLRRLANREPLKVTSLNSMTLDKDDVALARAWLRRQGDWYRSDEVERLQTAFAAWNGSGCALSFMGGRVALSAIIDALRLGPGDEVILPGYTCIVVPNAFHYAGVTTLYSDIELDTYGLEASRLDARIGPRTKAILLHHLYGLVCRDYEEILDIARRRRVHVIEDCAHSTGAEYRGIKVGNRGIAGFYSSQNAKVFNTIQGGIAVTGDERVARRLRLFQERALFPPAKAIEDQLYTLIHNYYSHKHAQRWWLADVAKIRYRDRLISHTTKEEKRGVRPAHYGCRMPAAIAAIGLNQLAKLDGYNELRRHSAHRWDRWCDEHGYRRPLVISGSLPVYLRYPVMVAPGRKQDTSWARTELGVSAGVWFVSHLHPADHWLENCPNATEAVRRCINLPTLAG